MSALSMVRSLFTDTAAPATVQQIDRQLADLGTDAKRLADHYADLEAEAEALRVDSDLKSFPAFKGSSEAAAGIEANEGRLLELAKLQWRAQAAAADVAKQQQALTAEREQAVQHEQADELREAVAVLEAIGRDAHETFTEAAKALDRFIAADTIATRLAVAMGQPSGRYLGARVQDVLSNYFSNAIGLMGTTLEVSVTHAARKQNFIGASLRPFSVGEKHEDA